MTQRPMPVTRNQPLRNTAARKTGAVAAAIAIVVVAGAWILAGSTPAQTAKSVTLVYVGAENCAPCDIWQRNYGNAFRTSAEFTRLNYREVKSPSLFDVLKDESWPEDLRAYRHSIARQAGVPLWLVIADDQIVLQGFGASQWSNTVLPKIRSLLQSR